MSTTVLNHATKMVSAFDSWKDLLNSVEHHGYVPTLRPDAYPPGKHRIAVLRLRSELAKRGYRVFPSYAPREHRRYGRGRSRAMARRRAKRRG